MNTYVRPTRIHNILASRVWRFVALLMLALSLLVPGPASVGAQGPSPDTQPTGGSPLDSRPVGASAQALDVLESVLEADAPSAVGPNLIANPGFELDANADTRPDNWTVNANVTRSNAAKRSGAYSMRHQANNNSSYTVYQVIPRVAAGKPHSVSSWVYIPATTDAFSMRIEVQWRNGAAVAGTTVLKNYTGPTTGWQRAMATVTPPAGTTAGIVRMVVASLNTVIYVDDMIVQEAASGGFFVDKTVKTTSASMAVDANGGTHIAFAEYTAYAQHPPAYYFYCPPGSNCTTFSSAWRGVRFPDYVDEVQLALTPAGQPRLLVDQWNSSTGHNQFVYWECPSACTTPSRWTGLIVNQYAGVDVFADDNPQRSFALDHLGRPRFVYSNAWGNGRPIGVFYAYCNANCTAPGTWFETPIYQGPEFRSLAFEYPSLKFTTTGQPRLVANMTFSGEGQGVMYLQCDTNCGVLAGWRGVKLYDRGGGTSASWDLELDRQNRPRFAFYQAGFTNGTGDQLYYVWCNANCLSAASWQRKTVGLNKGDGRNADLELDALGRPRIAFEDYYPAGRVPGLGYVWCNTACETATGTWLGRTIEPSNVLNADFQVPSPLICDPSSWLKAIPVLALDPAGDPRIAYDAINVATCYYTDVNGNKYSKVEQLSRGVRVMIAPQP